MRKAIGVIKPWSLLVLVPVLVSSCVHAADEQMNGGGGSRRRRAAAVLVPITLLKSAVDKGAGMYVLSMHRCVSSCFFSSILMESIICLIDSAGLLVRTADRFVREDTFGNQEYYRSQYKSSKITAFQTC